jgi:hypothetical protein
VTGKPTPRERAYIAAAAELFRDGEAATQRARTLAYEQAMEKLTRDYPGDMEAKIFYALAANQTALTTDKKYTQQLKAAAILEPLFKEHPTHPGLAHYIIHAYDHPPLAQKALVAARRYASLAPAVPHALHMPSHTFTRVGSWKESIETNRRSAEAARKSSTAGEELHALDYQAYAYLQIAQDAAAKQVLDRALTLVQGADGVAVGAAGAGAFAVAAIRESAGERAGQAAALPVRPAKTPYTEAISHPHGDRRCAFVTRPRPRHQLAEQRDAHEDAGCYWAEQVDIQRRIVLAWAAFASGDRQGGIDQLRTAADAGRSDGQVAVSPACAGASCWATCCRATDRRTHSLNSRPR